MDAKNLYKTNSLALAPYLACSGLQFIACEPDQNDSSKVIFIFSDPQNIGSELARSWLRSPEFKYKAAWAYFRNVLAQMKKGQ